MKMLAIVFAAMFLASCAGTGMHSASGASGTIGAGGTDNFRSSTAPFDPKDPYHGG